MPSLPSSDGFKSPVHSSGLSSKICNPTNQLLDRSVSAPASICSHKSSLAEIIDPTAVKSLESPAECQLAPDPLLLQNLSDHAARSAHNDHAIQTGAVACHSPTIPSQNTLEKTLAADHLMKYNAKEQAHGLESPMEVTREGSLSDTTSRNGQQAVLDVPLPSEQLELNQMNGFPLDLQTCKEPVSEQCLDKQNEPTEPEHPCNVSALGLPAVGEQGLTNIHPESPIDSLTERREGGLENIELLCGKENIPMSASCGCSHTEIFMETDVAEQSVVTVHSLSSKQNTQAKNIGGSVLNLDCSLMQMESSKHDLSVSVFSSNPVSTSDLLQPETNVEMTTICTELPNLSAENNSSSSDIRQLNSDAAASTEEPSLSLTAALKELHELLVINSKGDSVIFMSEEDAGQPETVPEEQMECKELSDDEHKSVDPESEDLNSSFRMVMPEHVNPEGLAGVPSYAMGIENASIKILTSSQSTVEKDALEIQKSSSKSNSVILSSVATFDQLQSTEQAEILPECLVNDQVPASQTSELNRSHSPELTVEDDPQDAQSLLTAVTERTDSSSNPEDTRPPCGLVEPLLCPPISNLELRSRAPPLPVFPAADINQILCAGFTMREALEALEQADGNANLALLFLLAKNIVVPT
uniref:Regulator of solute carriers 1 n=2 Tax=Chelonoidis abingdonii TaxID=106734 RepID=A0A8C0HB27_CHEAB